MFLASTSEKVTRDAPNNAAPGIRKRCSAPRARRAICGATSPIKPMTPVKHIAPAAMSEAARKVRSDQGSHHCGKGVVVPEY